MLILVKQLAKYVIITYELGSAHTKCVPVVYFNDDTRSPLLSLSLLRDLSVVKEMKFPFPTPPSRPRGRETASRTKS